MRTLVFGFAIVALGCSTSTGPQATGNFQHPSTGLNGVGVGVGSATAGNGSATGRSSGGQGSTSGGQTGGSGTGSGGNGSCPSACFGQFPVCSDSNQCVQCVRDSDCAAGVCDLEMGGLFQTCEQCDSAKPCPGAAYCSFGTCLPYCLDAGCGTNAKGVQETCDQTSGACLECTHASDCVAPSICLDGGFCGSCSGDSDCAVDPDGGQACSSGNCTQCHVNQASDPLCPDGGGCTGEGLCCGPAGFPCN